MTKRRMRSRSGSKRSFLGQPRPREQTESASPMQKATLLHQIAELRERVQKLEDEARQRRLCGPAREDSLPPNIERADVSERWQQIITRAEEVFGNPEKAHRWLRKPNRALGGRVPVDLVASENGTRDVETILGRIEYGVYS